VFLRFSRLRNHDTPRRAPDPAAESPTRPAWRIAGVRPRVAVLILAAQAVMVWWVADSEIARSVYLICYSLVSD
jgi:hypothetical protein